MILPVDPIMTAVVVVGVVIYFALKGNSDCSKSHKDRSIYDIYKEIGEQSSEYMRYQKRLRNGQ